MKLSDSRVKQEVVDALCNGEPVKRIAAKYGASGTGLLYRIRTWGISIEECQLAYAKKHRKQLQVLMAALMDGKSLRAALKAAELTSSQAFAFANRLGYNLKGAIEVSAHVREAEALTKAESESTTHWTIITGSVRREKNKELTVLARCVCGTERRVLARHIHTGWSNSCGCRGTRSPGYS